MEREGLSLLLPFSSVDKYLGSTYFLPLPSLLFPMNTSIKSAFRFSIRPLINRPYSLQFSAITARYMMNSETSAYQSSFGAGGNSGDSPKQIGQLQNLKLNDGTEIPMLGYGLGTAHYKANPDGQVDNGIVKTAVMAINAGYYHLDGAQGISRH